ncbi:hypothetical protein DYD21_09065 [Rhodohalobacter sp. SW132]|uniref:hypothetical protein n=1 Tax=Rhodohalobacter sp. SW132 TaxID=2293433 RepID=UPI000E2228D3|nr:hypothetical protein [Rhodohalobacter sp. SW132]REL33554.1 hypothetical protein DYD21_09065 [Rhodohalobacter sp. SW132]
MKRDTASSIIKLTAILVVFSGMILFSVVYLQVLNMNTMFQEMQGQAEMFNSAFSTLGWHGYTTPIVVIIWGIMLYVMNRPLSFLIAKN